jgi:hypothetical protein
MSEHLKGVSAGHIQRSIMIIPLRHMRCLEVAVAWPTYGLDRQSLATVPVRVLRPRAVDPRFTPLPRLPQ